jgi:hypothetical protein
VRTYDEALRKAEQAAEWRAHAEALAGALRDVLPLFYGVPSYWPSDQKKRDAAQGALSRLPADALREREVLEWCAIVLAEAEAAFKAERVEVWHARRVSALAALDAAREGTRRDKKRRRS